MKAYFALFTLHTRWQQLVGRVLRHKFEDFDIFRPEVLKTRIARIARGSHMPGFPVDGHICVCTYGVCIQYWSVHTSP